MRLSAVLLSAALATASMPAFAANLITNGGFETGDFTGWTVIAGATFVSGGGFAGYNPNSGNFFAALGNVGCCGTVAQTFSDTPGQQYQLTYFLASNGTTPNQFEASVDSTVFYNSTNVAATGAGAPFPYDEFTFTFTGTGSDTLTFTERNDPSYLALDDVSVTPTTNPIPEPSSLMLLGTGLIGACGAFRRRLVRG